MLWSRLASPGGKHGSRTGAAETAAPSAITSRAVASYPPLLLNRRSCIHPSLVATSTAFDAAGSTAIETTTNPQHASESAFGTTCAGKAAPEAYATVNAAAAET